MTEREYRHILDLVLDCRKTARDVIKAEAAGARDTEIERLEETDLTALVNVKQALQSHVTRPNR